jgi:hypothetical protein
MRFNIARRSLIFHTWGIMDDIKLHEQPQFLCQVDETELQRTYSSGSKKNVGSQGSKRIHSATHRNMDETMTVAACMNASGSNLIPPVILCIERYREEELATCLVAEITVRMPPKGYKTTNEFCRFLRHFSHHRLSGGHRAHLEPSLTNDVEKLDIQWLCHPA